MIELTIPLKPKAVQSVRFGSGKAYQKNDVKDFKRLIKYYFRKKYPKFKMYSGVPLIVNVEHRYKLPAKPVWKHEYVAIYGGYPKITNPDVMDNLNKGLMDALTGEIWQDDSIVYQGTPRKVWHFKNEIVLYVIEDKIPKNKKEFDTMLAETLS